ncbi:MAG: hypothetical protein JST92_08175 [Deltaproteobacteria bacterium]|nr:hypothetical protein [Deltaproteobacteria bacterium]
MTNVTLRGALLACTAAFALALTACGGTTVDCAHKGSCPNDTAPTQAEQTSCQAAIADADCGSVTVDFISCGVDHNSCDNSGKTEIDGNACASQIAAYFSCCQAHPTSKSCTT